MSTNPTTRLFDSATVKAARLAPDWWANADNPTCLPGCIERHDPDEFKVSGWLVCLLATFTDPHGLRLVDVFASQTAEDTGDVGEAVYEVLVIGPVEALSGPAAHDLAVALSRAAVLMGEVAP